MQIAEANKGILEIHSDKARLYANRGVDFVKNPSPNTSDRRVSLTGRTSTNAHTLTDEKWNTY